MPDAYTAWDKRHCQNSIIEKNYCLSQGFWQRNYIVRKCGLSAYFDVSSALAEFVFAYCTFFIVLLYIFVCMRLFNMLGLTSLCNVIWSSDRKGV